jgi:hypothetical protein
LSAGVRAGLPPASRKKKEAAQSPLFQVAEESSTTQLLEKLKKNTSVSPEKVKTEPEDEVLSPIIEEPWNWSQGEDFNLLGTSASGLGIDPFGTSDIGSAAPSSQTSTAAKLSELGLGKFLELEDITSANIRPEFVELIVNLITEKKMAGEVKWPIRGSKEAPKFNPEEPAELLRYIAQVEEIYEGKTPAKALKKKGLCKYVPSVTEQEWMAFDTFDDEFSYEKFKEEVINSYPEAAMLEKGSLARLEQICRENQRIGPKDLKTLLNFKRAFTMEAKKLQKPPTVIENHALVAKFANCLTDGFRENVFARLDMIANQQDGLKGVLEKLGVQMGVPAAQPPAQGAPPAVAPAEPIPRRPEDRYQWKEVIEAAETMARNMNPGSERWEELARSSRPGAATSPAVMVKTEPAYLTPVKEDIETLKQDISHVRDGMVTQSKMQKELLEVFKSLQQKLALPAPVPPPMQPMYQPQQAIPSMQYQSPAGHQQPYMGQQRSYAPQGQRYQNQERTNSGVCHYCHQTGHFINMCPARQVHLESGKVIVENGRTRFPDGKPIPWEPTDKTPREKVEEYHAVKETNAQFYHCDSEIPGMMHVPYKDTRFSQYTNKPRDTRDELIEKMRREAESQAVLNHNVVQPAVQQPVATATATPIVGVGAGTEDEKIQWMKMYEEKLGEERGRTVKELLEQLLTRSGEPSQGAESQQGFL